MPVVLLENTTGQPICRVVHASSFMHWVDLVTGAIRIGLGAYNNDSVYYSPPIRGSVAFVRMGGGIMQIHAGNVGRSVAVGREADAVLAIVGTLCWSEAQVRTQA